MRYMGIGVLALLLCTGCTYSNIAMLNKASIEDVKAGIQIIEKDIAKERQEAWDAKVAAISEGWDNDYALLKQTYADNPDALISGYEKLKEVYANRLKNEAILLDSVFTTRRQNRLQNFYNALATMQGVNEIIEAYKTPNWTSIQALSTAAMTLITEKK